MHILQNPKDHEHDRVTTGYIERLQEVENSPGLTRRLQDATPGDQQLMIDPNTLPGEKFIPELSRKWEKKVHALTDKQNRQLTKHWNLPLSEYGYRL